MSGAVGGERKERAAYLTDYARQGRTGVIERIERHVVDALAAALLALLELLQLFTGGGLLFLCAHGFPGLGEVLDGLLGIPCSPSFMRFSSLLTNVFHSEILRGGFFKWRTFWRMSRK